MIHISLETNNALATFLRRMSLPTLFSNSNFKENKNLHFLSTL